MAYVRQMEQLLSQSTKGNFQIVKIRDFKGKWVSVPQLVISP